MTLRTGHGNGAGSPRIEVQPPDEQAQPLVDLAAPLNFRSDGTIGDKATAKALGEKSGAVRRARTALTTAMGLGELANDAAFIPYRDAGDHFIEQHIAVLAKTAGGSVGPGPSSIIASAAVQLSASRYFSDKAMRTGDANLFTLASSLANASRQNLLAAYELAVREGKAVRVQDADAKLYEGASR